MAPSKDDDQTLPSKESGMYKSVLKFYEQKQYKKAVKIADQILSKCPNHGETHALKGLNLNHLGNKGDALECVKKAITLNMKSHVSWHVFGLIHKSDSNYSEAIKCYRNALRWDPNNVQILRDLSWLQIQERDTKGYAETRRKLLVLFTDNRSNWISLSIGHHLSKNYELAISILDAYRSTLNPNRVQPSYEDSEMLMYKARVLRENGEAVKALQLLEEKADEIVDVVSRREDRGSLQLELGFWDLAKEAYLEMMAVNPENYLYHRGLQCAILQDASHMTLSGCDLPFGVVDTTPEQRKELHDLYTKFVEESPKVWAHQRVLLDATVGDTFKERMDLFLQRYMRKGVPSLFSSVKIFYRRARGDESGLSDSQRQVAANKVSVIGELVEGYLSSLSESSKFPGGEAEEAPTVYLWALFFAARHFDLLGETTKALECVEKALQHTPTMVDLYQVKAKILKHAGDLKGATAAIDHGRKLDLADRYINSKCTKYMMRSGDIEDAVGTISLFTRHEGGSSLFNLYEMQCMWFEIEAGNAHLKKGEYRMALKYFLAVEKHFKEFQDDEFDFHSYCMRKVTMRSYLDLLKSQDDLRVDPFFVKGSHGAIQVLLELFDNKEKYVVKDPNKIENYENMTAAQRKTAKMKAKKAALKAAKAAEDAKKAEEEARLAAEKKAEKDPYGSGKKDEDPDGSKLLAETLKSPLEVGERICELMRLSRKSSKKETSVQSAADEFEVQVRLGNLVKALKALKYGVSISSPKHPLIFPRLVALLQGLTVGKFAYGPWMAKKDKLEVQETVCEVLKEECVALLGGSDCSLSAAELLNNSNASYPERAGAAEALLLMSVEGDSAIAAKKLLLNPVSPVTLKWLVHQHKVLKKLVISESDLKVFKANCKVLYPLSTDFAESS